MKERIGEILEDKRITQAEFANRVGISPATITHFFNGRNNLSETVVSKILLAYPEINPLWFLEGKGEKYQKQNEQLPLFNESQTIKEKRIFETIQSKEQIGNKEADIDANRKDFESMTPAVESNIIQNATTTQPISQSTSVQKQIRKIVFFYTDKTFEEYYPE